MRAPTPIRPGLSVVSERDFSYPEPGRIFQPSIFAYIRGKDVAAFLDMIENDLKTPPQALENVRFDYLSGREKTLCIKAFVHQVEHLKPRPVYPDHIESWLTTWERLNRAR